MSTWLAILISAFTLSLALIPISTHLGRIADYIEQIKNKNQ